MISLFFKIMDTFYYYEVENLHSVCTYKSDVEFDLFFK